MENRRNYEKKEIKPRWRYEGSLYPGLKKVHIGQDVWLVGKDSRIKDGRRHQVIYGPGNKEYHLYDNDVEFINKLDEPNEDYDLGYIHEANVVRHGNGALENKVKIYILTHILDAKENWCFDLNNKPITGSKVKIIYDNGTVKIVDYFSGEFEKAELVSKARKPLDIFTNSSWQEKYNKNKKLKGGQVFELTDREPIRKYVTPVAYRIKHGNN